MKKQGMIWIAVITMLALLVGVLATSARKPFLEFGWLKKNATVVQMGPIDIKTDIIMAGDTVTVDNWYQISGFYLPPLHQLKEAGKRCRDPGKVKSLQKIVT